MPQCAGCYKHYNYPQSPKAKEEEYVYCPHCRTSKYPEHEYVCAECSADLSGYMPSSSDNYTDES